MHPKIAVAAIFALVLVVPASGSTYTVNNLGDTADVTPGDDSCDAGGGVCTLRAAIIESNAHAGPDTIAFSVAGLISPALYPALSDTVIIDGTTAPGYAGVPLVHIDGGGTNLIGFRFDASAGSSRLTALEVSGYTGEGVLIDGDGITVQRCYIGPNEGGIVVSGSNDLIGGGDGFGNVISGNAGIGINIINAQSVTVSGNFIGTNAAGTAAVANQLGVSILDSTNTTIGEVGGRNVISGNAFQGIFVYGDSPGTVIDNNYIGTDVTGSNAVPNRDGIGCTAAHVTIGTTAGNVISGNAFDGIGIGASTTSFIIIRHNIIGLDAAGVSDVGNGDDGIEICCNATGASVLENTISGNGDRGIAVVNASGITIQGNDIRGNLAGIDVDASTNVTIGGSAAGTRNVISGNSASGIIVQSNASGVTIEGNSIGTDAAGLADLGNLQDGIDISFCTAGPLTITGNFISWNDGNGLTLVTISGMTFTNNVISHNANTGLLSAGPLDDNAFADNSFFSNGALGIDLAPVGVNPNDAQDPDAGANSRQNFPVISYATQLQIAGTINSNPNTALTIHLYSNTAADPSGFGEGETHLTGAVPVVTDAGGNANFIVFFGSPIPLGRVITGTADGPHGTSEFSAANVAVVAPPVLQFSSAAYNAAEGSGSALITVTRSGETNSLVTVQYSTAPGTASPSADYVPVVGGLAFAAGVTSQAFSVPITADNFDEPNETLTLSLSNPGSATLGLSSATLTINDDDPTPAITIDDNTQPEGTFGMSTMTFLVHLSNPSASTITVDFATAPGSATAGLDYTATSNTLTFNPGVTTQQISVPILGDTAMEGDETFFVNLTNASAGAAIGDNQAVGTIANDDVVAIPTLSQAMLALLAILLGLAAATRWKA